VRFVGTTWNNVFIDNQKLSSTISIFYSNIDISGATIVSSCEVSQEYRGMYKDLYFFDVSYELSENCGNSNIALEQDDTVYGKSVWNMNVQSRVELLWKYIDYSNSDLQKIKNTMEWEIQKNSIYKDYNWKNFIQYYSLLKWQRLYFEAKYELEMVESILDWREKKYISPVVWGALSFTHSKIPNSWRPYRAEYTDGIHHWWDIDWGMREQTVALDDGIIVRIVENFDVSDFSRIVYWPNLSENQQLKNLDILRWKQVWLKTLKGEVVFYSHLDSVDSNIEEWMIVQRGDKIGLTGVSWVPEVGYDDYHLHFAIMENPYDRDMAWSYDFWDYMAWDWLTKWMNYQQTVSATKEIFE